VHAIATLVTVAVAVPLPVVTTQFCPGFVGCVCTVTAYVSPLGTSVVNVNVVAFAATVSVLVVLPLIVSTNTNPDPTNPETLPPTAYVVPEPVPPEVVLVFNPLHAAISSANPVKTTNVDFLLGIISVLFSARPGSAIFRSSSAYGRRPSPIPRFPQSGSLSFGTLFKIFMARELTPNLILPFGYRSTVTCTPSLPLGRELGNNVSNGLCCTE
jgi:hypothetical protein